MEYGTNYKCSVCNKNRQILLDKPTHLEKVANSSNGLMHYSDVHYCKDGLLSVNNVHIDKNRAVRSFSIMELPEKMRGGTVFGGIPMPGQAPNAVITYKLTNIFEGKGGYRIKLVDDMLKVIINIGDVAMDEKPLERYMSKKHNIVLEYYPLVRKRPERIQRMWFQTLINALEELPPTRIGLFVEALRFVWKMDKLEPTELDVLQLKTILSTHNTTFKLLSKDEDKLNDLISKYGQEKKPILDHLLSSIESAPNITLEKIQGGIETDIVDLIHLCVILETKGILKINRPVG